MENVQSERSAKYSLFPFDKMCMQNLLFSSGGKSNPLEIVQEI